MIGMTLLRTAFTFGLLLFLTRLIGKKQIRQATFFDFITAIAVGDIAAEHLADPEEDFFPWLLATILWFGLTIAIDILVMKHRPLGKLLEGEPSVVIENGRIREKDLFRNYLRVDDLMARLRTQGYFNPTDVEYAVFETDGSMSVLPKSQARPVQPRDLGIPTQYEGITREVIVDRKVIPANLKQMGLSEEWLAGELVKQGYTGPDEIFYAALDTQGQLYIDGFADHLDRHRVEISDLGPH